MYIMKNINFWFYNFYITKSRTIFKFLTIRHDMAPQCTYITFPAMPSDQIGIIVCFLNIHVHFKVRRA